MITLSEDQICASCPNNIESFNDQSTRICKSNLKVQRYDQAILNKLSLKENQTIDFNEASAELQHKIQSGADLELICGDCEWFKICLSEWNKRFQNSKESNVQTETESASECLT